MRINHECEIETNKNAFTEWDRGGDEYPVLTQSRKRAKAQRGK
jgi:hypothetical protein